MLEDDAGQAAVLTRVAFEELTAPLVQRLWAPLAESGAAAMLQWADEPGWNTAQPPAVRALLAFICRYISHEFISHGYSNHEDAISTLPYPAPPTICCSDAGTVSLRALPSLWAAPRRGTLWTRWTRNTRRRRVA